MDIEDNDSALRDRFWEAERRKLDPTMARPIFPYTSSGNWVIAQLRESYDLVALLGPLPLEVGSFFEDPDPATPEQEAAVNLRWRQEEAIVNELVQQEVLARFAAFRSAQRAA